ncbi:copper resistance protein B [Hephaestia mangrovi]|uniref:copper resistance protein B n=1 Tax=Hephaestia mangrovi TaxID=2873268 RepID=UPI001CA72CA0|nr:copper resistance protein B [Hephaestia mangrovi]MBY8829697.1 copper resistance protein B [Hephaestia mangrovi]
MKPVLLLAAASAMAVTANPAAAQSMQGMQVPGMDMSKPMPAKKRAAPATSRRKTAVAQKRPATKAEPKPGHDSHGDPMKDMTMPAEGGETSSLPDMNMTADHDGAAASGMMPGMAMPASGQLTPSGTDLPPGDAPPPPVPTDHYADRTYTPAAMQPARAMFRHENGGEPFSQVMINLAELQVHDGRDGYRWEGEGWFGSDIDRLVVKSEGEGTFGKGVDSAEVQGLYSRAIGPYFDLQAGVRHDFQPSPTQTFATLGIEGLAPYQFDVSGAVFLSTKGDLLARTEGTYDERITQRLILQPRVELNFAAQDVPRDRIGAGLSNAELGVRLRYEISRQFAPYIGVSYTAKVGRSATFARQDGEAPHSTSLVLGIRAWF